MREQHHRDLSHTPNEDGTGLRILVQGGLHCIFVAKASCRSGVGRGVVYQAHFSLQIPLRSAHRTWKSTIWSGDLSLRIHYATIPNVFPTGYYFARQGKRHGRC